MFAWWKKFSVLSDLAVYVLIRTVVAVMEIFSLDACRSFAAFLAFVFTDLLRVRNGVLTANLRIAFPEADGRKRRRLIFAMWEHLFLMGAEFFIARRMLSELNWRRYIRLVDGQKMVHLFCSNRPLIMVTGHFGNFEMGGYILGLLGYPTFSVARSLDNRFLNRYIVRLRESTGQYLIEKNGGYEDILRTLENRGTVAFLADQSAGPKGCWVEFFGQPVSAYKAMALLSIQYDAPILVCHATRLGNLPMHFQLTPVDFFDPRCPPKNITSVFDITQWFTEKLEESIRKKPQQYWWLHRRWKDYGHKISIETIRAKRRKSANPPV